MVPASAASTACRLRFRFGKVILDDYKTLAQVTLEPYTVVLDSIVVKILLPVFTAILGYIFGTNSIKE